MKKITGIWENKYVCELGIVEHIREVDNLYSSWQQAKAKKNKEESEMLRAQWEKECADLYLILDKFLSPEILEERLGRFEQKRSENDSNC